MDVYQKLEELGLRLPPPPPKGGLYTPCKAFGGGLYYVSGCGPAIGGNPRLGRLGREVTLEEGQRAARDCMLNVLAVLEAAVGDLNRVKSPVKILTFVASGEGFAQQPQVADGGSRLLAALFGAQNVPARSAIGVNALPGGICVETEALFQVDD